MKKGRRYQDVITNNLKSIYIDQHFDGRERERERERERDKQTVNKHTKLKMNREKDDKKTVNKDRKLTMNNMNPCSPKENGVQ